MIRNATFLGVSERRRDAAGAMGDLLQWETRPSRQGARREEAILA